MTLSELRPLIDLGYEVYETTNTGVHYSKISNFTWNQLFSNDWVLTLSNDAVKTDVLFNIATKDADTTFMTNQVEYDKLQKANEMLYMLE